MRHTPDSYRREWAVLADRPEREVYVPEALRPNPLESEIRQLIDDVREGRTTRGTIPVSGYIGQQEGGWVTVGLARFQSYRARTEAALVQEIVELVEESNAQYLTYVVDASIGLVSLEV